MSSTNPEIFWGGLSLFRKGTFDPPELIESCTVDDVTLCPRVYRQDGVWVDRLRTYLPYTVLYVATCPSGLRHSL